MATTTPNFGWSVPTSTDLVKDGATAIETLGDSIDASLVDLKGGTTGQVLAKNSNTDMDFTWVTDAAGDITGVTAGTGITGGGTSGSVTVSFDQANFGGGQFAAGKNHIINGDFGIWQRGTSFSNPANESYLADRFNIVFDGSGSTRTVSRQSFTPGTAPVTGYESEYFIRMAQTVAGSGGTYLGFNQRMEDVRTFAGQTVTLSFWAKADATRTILPNLQQNFGSGGSSTVNITSGFTSTNLTTSWARYTFTVSVPSISGKTVGTSSFLQLFFGFAANTVQTIDIWGVQMEAGSTATPFQTATGTIQGELAACQRYYFRSSSTSTYGPVGGFSGVYSSSTVGRVLVASPVNMRVAPTSLDFSTIMLDDTGGAQAITSAFIASGGTWGGYVYFNIASGGTVYRPCVVINNNNAAGYVALSAEL